MLLQFPESLPVSGRRDEIARAIAGAPVVIVSGETGSGKTTQLPKICMLAGRGQRGLIGHTQPRRLAATTVARRIAEELGSPLGVDVGYKIRFNEKFATGARIKLMTDGILLAETQGDPLLSQYDTLIVDEAHERSLNIDFLLGYLKQLVAGPRRDDLKLVITSATIDADRFAEHFAIDGQRAPVIEVSGRLYPVEIRWRPLEAATEAARGHGREDDEDETDYPAAIEDALDELWRERRGDVLVFLPGEREIRDCAEHLRRAFAKRPGPLGAGGVEILPLYSRLSAADQQRVFAPGNRPRVVLSTNVAETSLTVPGIRYVIDTGLARVKRYRYRGKVEQLQVEPISQAAANQRAGRCGRVSDGVCVRLYSEQDFAGRPRFTDPEVLRSSLASVILRMKALRLVDIDEFPFVDRPPRKAIADGYELLRELNAIDDANALTPVGRELARLPVDPRVARMLLAARREHCLREVLVIAAALSVQDPRERPPDAQQAADQSHARFADDRSDFNGFLKLWDYWQGAQRNRSEGESNRRLAARIEREFLSPRKLREWADVHGQLADAVAELHWRPNAEPAEHDAVHRALLSGLLGNLGHKAVDEPYYLGTHGTKFLLHPGSALAKRGAKARAEAAAGGGPKWVMAAEIVDTGRLYARTVARIDPAAIERAAQHLLRRSWADPRWEKRAGQVVGSERATLYGLTIYAQRRVNYATIDPKLARELLIREALVAGDWDADLAFMKHNRRVIAQVEELEHKIRRPDLLVDEQFLFDWFDRQIPEHVTSGQSLSVWYREQVRERPELLKLSRDELLRKDTEGIDNESFPRRLAMRGIAFAADYHFAPGASDDGVTLTVPLYALNQVDAVRAEWLVPGMLADKIAALLKSLPQRLRRHVVPLPEWARDFADRWRERAGERALVDAVLDDLRELNGVRAAPSDFRLETLGAHLSMNFRVVDEHGRFLAMSRNLAQLRAQLGASAQHSFQAALQGLAQRMPAPADGRPRRGPGAEAVAADAADVPVAEAAGDAPPAGERRAATAAAPQARSTLRRAGERFTAWEFGELPELLELEGVGAGRGETLIGYPALVDRGDAVELQVFDEPEVAQREHRAGLRRLFAIALREPLRFFERNIPEFQRLGLLYLPFGTAEALRADLVVAVLERSAMADPLPKDAEAFAARVAGARPRLSLIGQELARTLLGVLDEHANVARRLKDAGRQHPAALADIQQQLAALLPKGFVASTEASRFPHLQRYLKGISLRLDKLRVDPARDAQKMAEIAPMVQNFTRRLGALKGRHDPQLADFRWLLEELRVSLFAQELRTPMPVSTKRLLKVWESINQ